MIIFLACLMGSLKGDGPLLHAAQRQARDAFQSNASLLPTDPIAIKAVEHAEGVAKILRENVVQGKAAGDNKYSRWLFSSMS